METKCTLACSSERSERRSERLERRWERLERRSERSEPRSEMSERRSEKLKRRSEHRWGLVGGSADGMGRTRGLKRCTSEGSNCK